MVFMKLQERKCDVHGCTNTAVAGSKKSCDSVVLLDEQVRIFVIAQKCAIFAIFIYD